MAYRWAAGKLDHLPALAAELVQLPVDVLVAVGDHAAFAAKNATSAIPIIFTGTSGPLALGLVSSLAQPGGYATWLIDRSGQEATYCCLNAVLRDYEPASRLVMVHTAVRKQARDPGGREVIALWQSLVHQLGH